MRTDKKLNVLLIGGWVDQAFTFVRSFSRQEHINLFVADCWPNSSCGFSKHCKRFHLIPMYKDPAYVPAILDVCSKEGIDVVLPVHHEDVVQVAQKKELFESAGVRLPIPSRSLIELANDKYGMTKLAQKAGIAVPETYLLSEIDPRDLGRSVALPVLVKLRNSTGQRGQAKIQSAEEFGAHIHALLERHTEEEVMVQEYIPGAVQDTMYTVGLLYNHNHQLRACVPLKKIRSRPYTGGTAICTTAENRSDLKDIAVRLMSTLGEWQGIADIEMKIDPDGRPTFIELNPRPWGSMYGAYAAGVDFPLLWVKVALCEDFRAVDDFREGIYVSFLSRDVALLGDVVRKLFTKEGREAWRVLKTYSRPYLRRSKNAQLGVTSDFVLDDLQPFIKNLGRFIKPY